MSVEWKIKTIQKVEDLIEEYETEIKPLLAISGLDNPSSIGSAIMIKIQRTKYVPDAKEALLRFNPHVIQFYKKLQRTGEEAAERALDKVFEHYYKRFRLSNYESKLFKEIQLENFWAGKNDER